MNNPVSATVLSSVELALESCQEAFKWERWNCPLNSFLSKRNSHNIDREQAFVKTLTTASLIYTLAKNCSKGNHESNLSCQEFLNSHHKAYRNSSRDLVLYANHHNTRAAGIVRLLID